MASQHPNAPARASGLVHQNVRLTHRYVVVSNDLAQHPALSFTARGLALHLQSLPAGAPVGIKALAAKAPESELRIAAAMRELERHGFLKRTRERLPDGRFLPCTISYNRPGADPGPVRTTPPPPRSPERAPVPEAVPGSEAEPDPEPEPEPGPEPDRPSGHRTGPPSPDPHRPSAELLAGLRVHEPRLLLSKRDVRRLAPGVTAWLERGADPAAVRRTLCAGLPHDLAHPAGLLAHRLAALLPPPLPAAPVRPAAPDPLQNCDDCDRAHRAPVPGPCPDCADAAAGGGGRAA
ncbi:helix-turn-helix domain-containing protein [Streptomyces omiyaensis]|uniref:helix-turn-helix domain-containing protein n=1 Tax=Streptomyces omiyaensis TaxID=68247 RepID=UPI003700B197